MPDNGPLLRTRGAELTDGAGRTVTLKGFGLGGWMNMENFITGYPGHEEGQREAVRRVLGDRLSALFFDRFLQYFFGEADADFIRSLGLNCVRIPVNYRHLEDDRDPFVVLESAFFHLDRAIGICASRGIYTIIDLHAVPGYQNQDWHCDNPTNQAFFWKHKHFRDRTVNLWDAIARRYLGNPWVAGYNVINEPADPSGQGLVPVYRILHDAIRAVDPDHVLFLEGNRYSNDFHMFEDPLPGCVYTLHDYPLPGFIGGGPYPGETRGQTINREVVEMNFLKKARYMLDRGIPIWAGEFGPVYTGDPERDAMRLRLLRDQLEIFAEYKASWTIWTLKDIGLQGVVHTAPDSPWMRRIRPILEKKARLGVDSWGGTDEKIRHVLDPIEKLFAQEYPAFDPFPFGARAYIHRLVRNILLSEPMIPEFAALFDGVTEEDIEELMGSFRFDACQRREPLARLLAEFA